MGEGRGGEEGGTRGERWYFDYASSRPQADGAWVAAVQEGSPAWEAGLEPGMRIDGVGGRPLRDIIDWRWEADGQVADLVVSVPGEKGTFACTLEREPGQDWGLTFTDVLFDGIRTCVNACQFCFMRMLPEDARSSLMLRDDDYRLSFLQGNFVTLTNVTDEDLERIIRCRLEPMNVSIHAITPAVRRSLIGPHAQRGIDVLERLCEAGLEVHGQIVLCAGINDGDELARTLDWVEARPAISSLAIVPMGYTRYSTRFSSSFSEDVEASRRVVELLGPYQRRARETRGITRFQLSDEFYLDARMDVPPAETYDGYPQYYDGIGMLRSFLDESEELCRLRGDDLALVTRRLRSRGLRALIVCGEAALGVNSRLVELWDAVCGGDCLVGVQAIRNDYYGGDVNVTGLIVSKDLLSQLAEDLSGTLVVIPQIMFNFDDVTLDGDDKGHIMDELARRGAHALACDTTPVALLDALAGTLGLA
ncbi:DUF512 domain-containing protein [Olsenella massiliensis]|uniref:DUF512 domain-containing protein n=1 Tax=Olsenella massiliensis TaxID=1622075 RepID=UPI00071E1E9E|nr:DUF512 domain-containing protein [Olsenella massiliensis]